MDDKYVVFKREQFDEWFNGSRAPRALPIPVPDATVIRRQDLFAGPALATYANSVGVAMAILPEDSEAKEGLEAVANYFHECSEKALTVEAKLPD